MYGSNTTMDAVFGQLIDTSEDEGMELELGINLNKASGFVITCELVNGLRERSQMTSSS